MKVVVLVAAALTSAALLTPTTSQAQSVSGEEQVSANVEVDGLDLASPAGRAIYERRLNTQIQRMCSDPGRRDLAALTATRECIAKARVL